MANYLRTIAIPLLVLLNLINGYFVPSKLVATVSEIMWLK